MSDSLSSDDVARLRQAAKAATIVIGTGAWPVHLDAGSGRSYFGHPTALVNFIAAANPVTVLALCDLVDGLTAARDTATQDADRLRREGIELLGELLVARGEA